MPESSLAVGFVCSAGEAIGIGHVARASTIAQAIRRRGGTASLRLEVAVDLGPLARSFDSVVTGRTDWDASIDWTALVYDPASMVACVRSTKVVLVDDGPPRALDADIIVNPNLSASADGYSSRGRVVAGPSFALVDPVFVAARPDRPRERGVVRNILIACGAADPTGMTERYLAAAAELLPLVRLRVALGPLNPRRGRLIELCEEVGAEPVVAAPTLAQVAEWCDLALTTLGVTAAEFACVGVPNMSVAISELQRPLLDAYGQLGVVWPVGFHGAVTDEQLRSHIREAVASPPRLRRLSATAFSLVDGYGADRVVDTILANESQAVVV